MITQRPALLNIVDKVLILRSGRAEAFGPPHDVLRRLLHERRAAQPPSRQPAPAGRSLAGRQRPAAARSKSRRR